MAESVKFDVIEAKSIVVRSDDGDHAVVIKAFESGVGMWIGCGSDSFCMLDSKIHGKYVGANAVSTSPTACPVALFFKDGEIYLQTVKDGNVTQVPLLSLIK